MCLFVDRHDDLEERHLLFGGAVHVHGVEGALLEEPVLQQLGDEEHEALLVGKHVRAHQPHDLLKLVLPLEDVQGRLSHLGPPRVHLLPPTPDVRDVFAVAGKPVDGGVVTGTREARVQGPVAPDEAAGMLSDGLGEIPARGRDGPDDGHRGLLSVQGGDETGAFVELGELGGKVGGEALLGGHLLEAGGELAQCLRPAAGRVGHHRDGVTHVTVVLGDGDAGVDGDFARGDGHVGGVGDEDGALHEGPAGPRVDELGEGHEDVGHFVSALPAADVDDDVGVAPLGEGMLDDGLSGAEPPRDAGRAAPSEREERVDDPLSRDQGNLGDPTCEDGPGPARGPRLHHGEGVLALRARQAHEDVLERVVPFGDARLDDAFDGGRDEEAVS